jgi:hypothetical protein
MADEFRPTDPSPPPLDYHRDVATPTSTASIIGLVMSGIFVSIFVVGAAGVFAFLPAHPNFPSSAPPTGLTAIGRAFQIAFFALAVAAFALTVKVWRSKPRSRWFFTGFLIGAGLMCLLEGACFSSP